MNFSSHHRPGRVTALLAAVVLAVTGVSGCGVIGGSDLEFSAEFSDSAGLFVGNDVGIRGVTVGRVTEIEPQGASVMVTMAIENDDVTIPADAKALIVSRSVATDRYVELTPAYVSGARLESGATIPLERTETPVDFDQVLDALNEFSVGIAGNDETAQAVRRFLEVGAETFGRNGKPLNDAILKLSEAVNGVSGQRENIVGTMTSLDGLATELVRNRSTIQEFIDSVAATTTILAQERENFRSALTKLQRTVELVATFAERNKDQLKGTVSDVADVSDILLSRRPQLEEFITTMPLAMQNLARAGVPEGILIRAPLGDILTGGALQDLCQTLQQQGLCDLVGSDITGALADLLEDLGLPIGGILPLPREGGPRG